MAEVNGNLHDFKKDSPVRIDDQANRYILLKDDFMDLMYGTKFLEHNPQYMKQQSEKWKRLCEHSCITGSTMHDALGLRTLKSQKLHFEKFVAKSTTNEKPKEAMVHGTKHEVN